MASRSAPARLLSFGSFVWFAACAPAATPPPREAPPAPACAARVDALLAKMTLDEKLGQMVQAERKVVEKGDVAKYFLGSILSGGGSAPGGATPGEWADMTDALHAEARTTRLGIPLLYASDAVHGHNNVVGATIFPHQIGLGCTRDPALIEAVARATAQEIAGTGVDWTFAPLVGPARDPRWGRFYETYAERPEVSGLLGAAAIRGLQGDRLGGTGVLACAKHFAGDGLTTFGTTKGEGLIDRGDVQMGDDDFMRVAVAPYASSIAAGVGSIMVSFNSVRGTPMHANEALVTDVLKRRMRFEGVVISDWSALRLLPGSYYEQVVASVNAGIDVTMDAEKLYWRDFLRTAKEAVQKGDISMARVDDAVRRVLAVKCELGVFDRAQRTDRALTAKIGSAEHRALARRAAQASFVLLRNEANLLPLSKAARLVVTGSGASSLARQAGGWTVDWQGAEGKSFPGTTILEGLRAAGDPARVHADPAKPADIAIVVASEPPYAEWEGDAKDPALSNEDVDAIDRANKTGLPVVVVLLSGRPIAVAPHLRKASAWLAAWLPGSEGAAVADVVFGDVTPTGKLAHAWPVRAGASGPPLFDFGFGLSYPTSSTKR
ncbi:MAG: glycoside hydrolase family 3 C-terminal domain-containing protein [Labilithrix sp.]|nr:glycoside hydrolase family 3 C-terminal domain-containing protein [Labilithrix sp.]